MYSTVLVDVEQTKRFHALKNEERNTPFYIVLYGHLFGGMHPIGVNFTSTMLFVQSRWHTQLMWCASGVTPVKSFNLLGAER